MADVRKPLIAGNWKCNLNHFEAIALVQKIAFALPEKYFDKVDVTSRTELVAKLFADHYADPFHETLVHLH